MIEKRSVVAVIPARGGSKRLARKNIKLLGNEPLIAWTIKAALESKYIDEVVVSTEDAAIARIAEEVGARVPFMRPLYLAEDTTKSIDVVRHAVEYYKDSQNRDFDLTLLLQPTSPLRTAKHIDEAIEELIQKSADAVISVCETEHNPRWSNLLPLDLSMQNFLDSKYINARSQDLEPFYRLNGAIYLCDTQKMLLQNSFFLESKIFAYVMSQEASVDIDTELDFLFAQTIINQRGHMNEK